MLVVEGAVGGYGAADEVLKGVGLRVEAGEIVTIIGPNGAGKSTFLKMVAGLLTQRAGTKVFAGQDVTGLGAAGLSRLGVGFVPQERNVFPTLQVGENLLVSAHLAPRAARSRAAEMLSRFPILAERRRQPARSLSGGQRQVLAMAMGLMMAPRLLLLDEPTAGLSPQAAEALFETVRAINRDGTAVLMVEQNALDALEISHRAYLFVAGRNMREGAGPELASNPEIRRLFLGG